ncbi:transcriptional regulator [Aquilutibacter rugosus]|uniref:transcriptional regulator n=1 Tax=Aquilutibacter rugosus TaxID=3115820 RepID=UPI002F4278F7
MDIQTAIEICGSRAELANRLGLTASAVSQWANGTRPVPPVQCIPIEEATSGKVTRYQLRPDVFGVDPAPSPVTE